MKLLKTNLDHTDDHSNNYLKLGDWYVDNDLKNKKNIKLRLIEEKKTFKFQIKNLIGILSSLIPNVLNRHVIISSYLTLPKLISLQLSLKQFPYVISPNIDFGKKNYNCTMRNKIFEDVELINNLGFTNFLQVMIRQQIPYAYIENFTKIK